MAQTNCNKCNIETDPSKDEVKCFGPCGKIFHYKCIKINKNIYEGISSCNQIKYICTKCQKY